MSWLRGPARSLLRGTVLYRWYRDRRQRQQFWRFDDDDRVRLRFYTRFVSKNDLVFDVGANLGNRSKLFLRLGARVVGFEPQASCADFLARILGADPSFTLERKALGANPGHTEMMVSNSHTISSLSGPWVEAVKESGRFHDCSWDRRQPVEVDTLDAAIRRHGMPSFIKIDVEGYEAEVLAGLSVAPRWLSFEFTPEILESAATCIDRLAEIAPDALFQYSIGDSMVMALSDWVSASTIKSRLAEVDRRVYGDVYCRTGPR